MFVFPHFAPSLCICCRRVLCGSLDCPCPLWLARAVLKSARKANLDWTLVQWFSMECHKTKPNENLTETQITGAKRGKSHVSNWCLDWLCARILKQSQPQNQSNPGLPWNIVTLYISVSFRPFTFALSESPLYTLTLVQSVKSYLRQHTACTNCLKRTSERAPAFSVNRNSFFPVLLFCSYNVYPW